MAAICENSPRLPDDVLQHIVDAFSSQPELRNEAFRLLTVSKNFKAWTEPRLYAKLIIRNMEQAMSFVDAIRDKFTFCQPARLVKILWSLCQEAGMVLRLYGAPYKCPNLLHFAFDGYNDDFPFSTIGYTGQASHLSRLSICSPVFTSERLLGTSPPFRCEDLTHLQVFAPAGLGIARVHNVFIMEQLDRLVSLEHVLIEVTYIPPAVLHSGVKLNDTDILNTIIYINVAIRKMLACIRTLRQVTVKFATFTTGLEHVWGAMQKDLKDEARVVFVPLAPVDEEEIGKVWTALMHKSPEVSGLAWQNILVSALDEAERFWGRRLS